MRRPPGAAGARPRERRRGAGDCRRTVRRPRPRSSSSVSPNSTAWTLGRARMSIWPSERRAFGRRRRRPWPTSPPPRDGFGRRRRSASRPGRRRALERARERDAAGNGTDAEMPVAGAALGGQPGHRPRALRVRRGRRRFRRGRRGLRRSTRSAGEASRSGCSPCGPRPASWASTLDGPAGARARLAERLRAIERRRGLAPRPRGRRGRRSRAPISAATAALTAARRRRRRPAGDGGDAELAPLKLDKARFRVAVEPLAEEPRRARRRSTGWQFEIATNPGAPFGAAGRDRLGRRARPPRAGAEGGARRPRRRTQPLMIFDEVDQGVGGAVADAVGLRLKRLAAGGAGARRHPQPADRRPR